MILFTRIRRQNRLTYYINYTILKKMKIKYCSYQEWQRDWPYDARQPSNSLEGAKSYKQ